MCSQLPYRTLTASTLTILAGVGYIVIKECPVYEKRGGATMIKRGLEEIQTAH